MAEESVKTGYLKLYRSTFSHWLWEEERSFSQFEAFTDLLQLAAFAPTKRVVKGKLISLSVGELIASERFLEVRWKWSRTKVRRFEQNLISDGMLDQRKDQQETVLILCNYRDFQSGVNHEKTRENTTKEPSEDQRGTSGEPNKKKVKKVEELKEKSDSADAPSASLPPSLPFGEPFADAWRRWEKHRKEIKKPLRPTQTEAQLNRLSAMTEDQAVAMIDHTIEMGWQGLREGEPVNRSQGNKKSQSTLEELMGGRKLNITKASDIQNNEHEFDNEPEF